MIPRNSPSRTSRSTSATMVAPPMSSPRLRVARIGGASPMGVLVLEGRDRWRDSPHRERCDRDRLPLSTHSPQPDVEHRLEHGVVGLPDLLLALRADEPPALESGDHPVDVAPSAPCHGA